MKQSNCILLVSDQEYLKYFYPLAFSIRKHVNMDDVAVRMHLINISKDDQIRIVDTFTNASLTFETKNLSTVKNKPTRYDGMPLLNGDLVSDKHAYCNNRRYEFIRYLLETNYTNILYMDVDNLIRGDIQPLFDIVNEHDITIHKYPLDRHPIAWRKFMTYCCGIIGIHNNNTTKKFFSELHTNIVSNGETEIGDQLDFYELTKKYREELNIGQIPQEFKDDEFKDDSKIWTGDGNRKFSDTFSKALCS